MDGWALTLRFLSHHPSRAWLVFMLSASGKKHDLSIGRTTREGKRENSLPSIESWFLSRFTRYYACKTWLDRTTYGDDFEEEFKVGKGCLTYMFEDSIFLLELKREPKKRATWGGNSFRVTRNNRMRPFIHNIFSTLSPSFEFRPE